MLLRFRQKSANKLANFCLKRVAVSPHRGLIPLTRDRRSGDSTFCLRSVDTGEPSPEARAGARTPGSLQFPRRFLDWGFPGFARQRGAVAGSTRWSAHFRILTVPRLALAKLGRFAGLTRYPKRSDPSGSVLNPRIDGKICLGNLRFARFPRISLAQVPPPSRRRKHALEHALPTPYSTTKWLAAVGAVAGSTRWSAHFRLLTVSTRARRPRGVGLRPGHPPTLY